MFFKNCLFPFTRKHIRTSLKDQMSEKDSVHKTFMKDRVGESQTALAYDRKCLDTDREALKNKSLYLHQFRDDNKKVNMFVFHVNKTLQGSHIDPL